MSATIPDLGPQPAEAILTPEVREAVLSQLEPLRSCGTNTRAEVDGLTEQARLRLETLGESKLANAGDEMQALREIAEILATHLSGKWTDVCAAQVLFFVSGRLKEQKPSLRYIADNIATWLDKHVDDPEKFNFCLQIEPPAGIAIERVLNAGAEKQVFVAQWPDVTPYKVAFKRFHDSERSGGDAFPHPLRGHHPNIIETFPLENAGGGDDLYLVERLLSTTLHYGWKFGGLGEIVNLLRDIAHALSFVHSYDRIHGDVKLENIGFERLYILLDFGLCRPEPTDVSASSPTGNVRAMAPELLHGEANTRPADIWALGSVAYSALCKQPPFMTPQEKQHGFAGAERARKLKSLAKRADSTKWRRDIGRRLAEAVPEIPLRELLAEMLDYDPAQRPTALQVFQRCSEELPQFLRPVDPIIQAAPGEVLDSLLYLQKAGHLSLASRTQLINLGDAARHIEVDRLGKRKKPELDTLQKKLDVLQAETESR